MKENATFRLAAVLYDPSQGGDVDDLLLSLVKALRKRNVRVAGAVQLNGPAESGPCSEMVLEDLASGRRVRISQNRGPLARGCRLDNSALEEVAGLTRASVGEGVDCVIINKFSKTEADGGGLRQAIEAAVLADIPVVVGLNSTQRSAWETFSGGATAWLPRDEAVILGWLEDTMRHAARSAAS